MESLHKSSILQRSAACGEEPVLEQVLWQKLQPMGELCWSSAFLKECSLWYRPILEQFLNCSPWEGPMLE